MEYNRAKTDMKRLLFTIIFLIVCCIVFAQKSGTTYYFRDNSNSYVQAYYSEFELYGLKSKSFSITLFSHNGSILYGINEFTHVKDGIYCYSSKDNLSIAHSSDISELYIHNIGLFKACSKSECEAGIKHFEEVYRSLLEYSVSLTQQGRPSTVIYNAQTGQMSPLTGRQSFNFEQNAINNESAGQTCYKTCPVCDGCGRYYDIRYDDPKTTARFCSICSGTGKIRCETHVPIDVSINKKGTCR